MRRIDLARASWPQVILTRVSRYQRLHCPVDGLDRRGILSPGSCQPFCYTSCDRFAQNLVRLPETVIYLTVCANN
jgi:hypothetical protein